MRYGNKGSSTPTGQSSLAGGIFDDEEELQQSKRAKLRKKYKVMSVILTVIVFAATAALILSYDKCKSKGHTWLSATCTAPRICTVCDVTEGAPLGHDWLGATCMAPKTCQACGITEGEKLEHDWQNSTYQQARICTFCKIADGRSLAYPLTNCTVIDDSNESNSQTDVQEGDFTDVYTTYYRDALKFWVRESPNWADTEHIEYELRSSYELLEFKISAEATNHSDGTVKILIYADSVLVYESEWVGNHTDPVQGSLDVSNVERLKIVCTTDSPVFCHCIFDADLFIQS